MDRGPDTIRLYRLMMKLTKQAKEAGGAVFSLLGNHEIMNMMEDLRYVDPGDTDSFGGEEKRKEAWSKDGWLGQYLRSLNITVQVDETVFVHGGIHPDWAKFGVEVCFFLSLPFLASLAGCNLHAHREHSRLTHSMSTSHSIKSQWNVLRKTLRMSSGMLKSFMGQ